MEVRVLSPHRDDAAFSCGLLMRDLLALGANVEIVNVCTVSAYSPYLTATAGDRVEQVTRARAAEDHKFVEQLAAMSQVPMQRVSLIDLEWQDAPLRKSFADEEVLTTSVDEGERLRLTSALAGMASPSLVLVPAGIGGHVDHLLVCEAAIEAFSSSTILFYEDLPYTCRQANAGLPTRKRGSEEWLGPVQSMSDGKRLLALNYQSQIACSVADEMQAYANALGGRERFFGAPEAVQTISAAFQTQGVSA